MHMNAFLCSHYLYQYEVFIPISYTARNFSLIFYPNNAICVFEWHFKYKVLCEKQKGFVRLVYATKYSWQGMCAAWQGEAAFRQELVSFFVLLPVAILLPVSGLEKLLLIG